MNGRRHSQACRWLPPFGGTLHEHAGCLQGEIAHVEHANGKLPNGKAPALLDAPLEAEEAVEEAAALDQGVATMMSRDARQLFLAGDPAAGLQAWRVRPHVQSSPNCSAWRPAEASEMTVAEHA